MRLDITVTGDADARAELLRLGSVARQALDATAEQAESLVEDGATAHTKGGALFRSVMKRRDGDGWTIGHDRQVAPHALFVLLGTKPHTIKPKDKRALRWANGGGFAFARVVHHPGYAGDPYVDRAAEATPAIFERVLRARMKA